MDIVIVAGIMFVAMLIGGVATMVFSRSGSNEYGYGLLLMVIGIVGAVIFFGAIGSSKHKSDVFVIEPTIITKTEDGYTVLTHKKGVVSSQLTSVYLAPSTNLVIHHTVDKDHYQRIIKEKYSVALR